MPAEQGRPLGRVQLAGVVEQQHVAGLGEGVLAGRRRRVERGQHVVPLRGEGVSHALAPATQVGEIVWVGVQAAGPGGWVAVDLVAHGQRRGVPEHHVRVGDPRARQSQTGAEGEVVDDDVVGSHALDHMLHLTSDPKGLPEQVVPAGVRLEGQRRDRAEPGGIEEPPQGYVLSGGLVLGPDDPGVGAPSQPEVLALEAEPPHDGVSGGAGGDDDPLPRRRPGGAHRGERQQVGGVVRTDDQQRHGRPPSRARRGTWPWSRC